MNKDVNKYNKSIHRLGYIFTAFISVAVVAVPVVVCTVYDCMPKFSNIIGPMLTIMAAFLPVQLSEVISFAPILGSASYMTFVTGNVTNLKLHQKVAHSCVAHGDYSPSNSVCPNLCQDSKLLSDRSNCFYHSLGVLPL